MSFSYDANLSTTRDYLRFRLDDTVEFGPGPNGTSATIAIFSNEEINALIGRFGDGDGGLAVAQQLAMRGYVRAIKQAIVYRTGAAGVNDTLSVDRRTIPKYWLDLAKSFREEAALLPEEAIDSFAFHIDTYGHDCSDYVGGAVRDFGF